MQNEKDEGKTKAESETAGEATCRHETPFGQTEPCSSRAKKVPVLAPLWGPAKEHRMDLCSAKLMRTFIGCLVTATVALVAGSSPAFAQTNTGEIAGLVTDTSGGVLPGVTVTARHAASGTIVERIAGADGRFFLPALRVGQWDITAALNGFEPQTRAGVSVTIGRTLSLEFTLAVRGLTEQVVVQAHVPILQSSSAEISDVIENREILQLPINGRKFMALAQLSD